MDRVKDLIKKAGGNILLTDHRISSPEIDIPFIGTLRESQKEAIEVMGKNDFGVLCAPPGTGKTVMGCALIASRKVKTVILVHRQTLLDQWKERLQEFLKIDKKQIGVFKSGKSFEKCSVVLAIAQSLSKNPEAEAFLSEFGQVIVDECTCFVTASKPIENSGINMIRLMGHLKVTSLTVQKMDIDSVVSNGTI